MPIPSREKLLHVWLCGTVTPLQRLTKVNTRCFHHLPGQRPDPTKNNMALVPFLDMINHSLTENVDVAANTLIISALRPIEKGEEIVFSYHRSQPYRFWICEYGFWPPDGVIYDDLDITEEVEALVSSRREWLEQYDYWGDYTISVEGEVSFRIEVALRSIQGDEQSLLGFMDGRRDGEEEQGYVDGLLREILGKKVRECERALKKLGGNEIEDIVAEKLWDAELHIAKETLEQFI